jgi:hypothetical protein
MDNDLTDYYLIAKEIIRTYVINKIENKNLKNLNIENIISDSYKHCFSDKKMYDLFNEDHVMDSDDDSLKIIDSCELYSSGEDSVVRFLVQNYLSTKVLNSVSDKINFE